MFVLIQNGKRIATGLFGRTIIEIYSQAIQPVDVVIHYDILEEILNNMKPGEVYSNLLYGYSIEKIA